MDAPGRRAERRAARWYRLRGYRVLARNAWAAGYELDLVLRRGRRLVFCEVKEKTGDGFGEPAEMVDGEKQRRLRRAAAAWLAQNAGTAGLTVSFDVMAVRGRRLRRIGQAF
ncbi:MAG TPA: YraN family protein [Gaiellaceae bacterium]|jgi:putative endonuclease|nr:YraN family protein [Gaiellaceae bacterium]HWJ45786.1 YraN family protein [Gaiellaceae bacterium]